MRARAMRRRLGRALRATGRLTVRTSLRILLYATVAGVSVAAGLAVVALAGEYGYHPVRNAATWASQPIQFAVAGTCASCHGDKATAVSTRGHAEVSCQSCHGPRADHAAAKAGVTLTVAPAPAAAPAACVVCHERVSGRPAGFPVVSAARHFGGAPCLLCHDPHATTAVAAPPVKHSLDRLPDCLVCHGPDGLRPMPQGHPVWPQGDCLTCHLRQQAVAQ
jgi:cytochrome c553